jgi:negative regulator of sigma E activity
VNRVIGKDTAMTATKAVASGVAANVVTLVVWGIRTVPGWETLPDEPKAAVLALASAAVGAAIVYFAPANKDTLEAGVPAARERLSVSRDLAGATAE